MKIFVSESARTQTWFDGLSKKDQKEYLVAHPKSKFGTRAGPSPKMAAIKTKLDALRKRLGTAKPTEMPGIRREIAALRANIAGVKPEPKPVARPRAASTKRSAAAPVPVRALQRDIRAKQAELDAHLAKKPRSEAGKTKHAATTKELKSSLRKLGRQHTKATETLAGQDRVLKALDSKKPAAAKSPVKVKRGVPANPKKPARFAGPASHPSNRGTGNTVMGPGWKKKSGVGEHEWNTYEHPDGHQVRVSKTAGTAYQQGQGPARKVKVHKVETKAAGSNKWSSYGEVEKHQVSGAGRSFPKSQ